MHSRYNHLPSYKYTDVEDVSPILEKSAGKALRNYKIYGNSVQSGIPSVEQPQEIKCVGDKTKNLWSYGDLNTSTNKNAVFDFNLTGAYVFSFALNYESCELPSSALFQFTVDGAAKYLAPVNVVTNGASRASIRISGHITKIQLINWSSLIGNIIDIQLEEGTSMTEYEPYGYKIPISVRGKNIFNYKDFIQAIKNSDMTAKDKANADDNYLGEECFSYANWGRNSDSVVIPIEIWGFKENTQYTFSGEYAFKYLSNEEYNMSMLAIYYTDGTISQIGISNGKAYSNKYSKVNVTSSAGKTIESLRINSFADNATIYVKKNFQIEEGTVATLYEPYVESREYNIFMGEPLRKIGDYSDYIDFKNGKIVRNVKEDSYNGTEKWEFYPSNGISDYYGLRLGVFNSIVSDVALCTHFENLYIASTNTLKGFRLFNSSGYNDARIIIRPENVEEYNYTSWINFVTEQYNNGTPIKTIYVLTTPVEEPIDLPVLETNKFTNVIEVDTSLQPSNVIAQYYKKG